MHVCICFWESTIYKRDLDAFVVEWNTHPLRPNPNDSPPGHPDDIYAKPTIHGEVKLGINYLTLFNVNRKARSTNAH